MAPSAQAFSTLYLVSSRRSTYHKTRKGSQRAQNWPFALTGAHAHESTIHPDKLAQAGFYSTPTSDAPTRSTCYACGFVVDELNEGDDATRLHANAAGASLCGWNTLQQIRDTWPEGVLDKADWRDNAAEAPVRPNSHELAQARLHSFELGWPHEGQDGVPTKEEIATAGWFFRPGTGDASDNCVCPYCTRTVEGWEPEDDPVALHKRKLGLKCPFFLDPKPAEEAAAIPPKMSRSRGRTHLAMSEADAEDPDADEAQAEEVVEEPLQKPRATRRGAKIPASPAPSTASAATTRGTRATRQSKRATTGGPTPSTADDSVIIEADKAQSMDEPVAEAKQKRSGRTTRGTKTGQDADAPAKPARSSRKPAPAKDEVAAVEDEEMAQEEAHQAEAQVEANTEPEVEVEVTAEEPEADTTASSKPAAGKKRATRTTKSKAAKETASIETAETAEADDSAEAPRQDQGVEIDSTVPEDPKPVATKARTKKAKSTTSKARSKKAPGRIEIAEEADEAALPVSAAISHGAKTSSRGPLTPTAGSNGASAAVPAPARSSKTEPSIDVASLTKAFVPGTNPFDLTRSLSTLQPSETDLTIFQFYNHVGKQTYEALEKSLQAEYDAFEARVDKGRQVLTRMIDEARARERV